MSGGKKGRKMTKAVSTPEKSAVEKKNKGNEKLNSVTIDMFEEPTNQRQRTTVCEVVQDVIQDPRAGRLIRKTLKGTLISVALLEAGATGVAGEAIKGVSKKIIEKAIPHVGKVMDKSVEEVIQICKDVGCPIM